MAEKISYHNGYFDRRREEGRCAAQIIVPILLKLFRPKSIIDVGCGSGAWLDIFQQHHIDDVVGVDGDWVNVQTLPFASGRFISANLELPLSVNRTFDLALCLEVAEHLSAGRAPSLVKDLTQMAPVVVFSAAIPNQGGTGHVNEQWPSYWAALFAGEGYLAYDCIREQVWQAPIPFWYAQNTVLYVREEHVTSLPALPSHRNDMPMSLVHPDLLERIANQQAPSLFRRFKSRVRSFQKSLAACSIR